MPKTLPRGMSPTLARQMMRQEKAKLTNRQIEIQRQLTALNAEYEKNRERLSDIEYGENLLGH